MDNTVRSCGALHLSMLMMWFHIQTVQVKAEIPHTQSLNYLAETLLQFSHNVPTAPEQAVPEIRAFSNSKDERISESPIFQMDMQNDGRVHRGRDESPDNEDMEVVIDSPVHNDFIDSGGINAESEMLSPTGRPQRTCRTRPILSNIQPSPYKDRDLEVVDGDGEDDYDADEASPRSRSRRRGTPKYDNHHDDVSLTVVRGREVTIHGHTAVPPHMMMVVVVSRCRHRMQVVHLYLVDISLRIGSVNVCVFSSLDSVSLWRT